MRAFWHRRRYLAGRTLVGLLIPWTLIGLIPFHDSTSTTVFFVIWTVILLASIGLTVVTLVRRQFRELVLAPLWLVKNVGIGLAFTGLVVFTIGATLPILFGPGFIFVLLGIIAAPFLGAAWLYQRLSQPKTAAKPKTHTWTQRQPPGEDTAEYPTTEIPPMKFCVDKGWLRFQRPDGLWTWERPLIDENEYWRRIGELDALGMDGERVENQRLHNELAARMGWK